MNAKKELQEEISDKPRIKCALLENVSDWNNKQEFILKVGYSQEEMDIFLDSLDFEYDSGYGGQELEGTVWFEDGTWLERGEYDGREWWEYKKTPDIPSKLVKPL